MFRSRALDSISVLPRGGSSPKFGGATEPKIVKNILFLKKIGGQRVGNGGFGGQLPDLPPPLDPLVFLNYAAGQRQCME